jgi:hypothetical protein
MNEIIKEIVGIMFAGVFITFGCIAIIGSVCVCVKSIRETFWG